jgi:putative DNA methylase
MVNPSATPAAPGRGEIKIPKVRFFRPPNDSDSQALREAERRLQEKWPAWEAAGLIPPEARYAGMADRMANYGMTAFYGLFTVCQLMGHLTLAGVTQRR